MPTPARAYLMTDADVQRTVTRYADLRPAAPLALPAGPAVPSPRPEPEHDDRPDRTLLDALDRAPAEGITVPELVTATGRSRRWVYYRLRALAAEDRVEQVEYGLWRSSTDHAE